MYLDYQKQSDRYWTIDTEANSLNPTQFWCAVCVNLGTNEELIFDTEAMYDGRFKRFAEDKSIYIVGHNFCSWDSHWLRVNKIADISIDRIIDSLVLSYLYNPYLPDGHSLEAYGNRFSVPKIGHEDWSHYSPEMLERCRRDVRINVLTYKALCKRMLDIGYSERSCEIECRIRFCIDKQERRGFYFDKQCAEQLVSRLATELTGLSSPIQDLFPPTLEPVKSYPYRLKKDGEPTHHYLRHQQDYDAIKFNEDGSEYTTYAYKPFNIGSPPQRIDKLLGLGWTPTVFTEAGNPKVDEDALKAFAEECGDKRIGLIADWMVRASRKSMVEGWLKVLGADSRIHGVLFTNGAGTRRARHNKPNTANCPGNESLYGEECRDLWQASEGLVLVGADAKAVQMRIFADYLDNPTVTEKILHGDPHQENSNDSGVTRKRVKNCYYALLLGASDKRLGITAEMNGSPKLGKHVRSVLYRNTPGLEGVIEEAEAEYRSNGGLMRSIDGGFARCPGQHAALAYRIQADEACLIKQTIIMLDKKIQEEALDAHQVAWIHDEIQVETQPDQAERLGELFNKTITEAGESLGFKVVMDGSYKIGPSWKSTH